MENGRRPVEKSAWLLMATAVLMIGCGPVWSETAGYGARGSGLILQGKSVPLNILFQDDAGTVYLPLAYLASIQGLQCARDKRTAVVQLRFKTREVCLAPGVFALMVDGKRIPLPAAPHEVGGALVVPLRPVARSLGLELSLEPGLSPSSQARRRLSRVTADSGLPPEFAENVDKESRGGGTEEYSFSRTSDYLEEVFDRSDHRIYPRGRYCVGLDAGYYKPWGGEVPKSSLEWKPIVGAHVGYAFHRRLSVEERYEVWKLSMGGRHFFNPQRDGTFRLEVKSLFLGLVHYFPSSSRWRFGIACGGVLNWFRLGYENGMIAFMKKDDTVGYEIGVRGEYFLDEKVSVTMAARYRGGRAEFSIPEVNQEFELELDSAFGSFGINFYFD